MDTPLICSYGLAGLNEYPQHTFLWRNNKNVNFFGLKKKIILSRVMHIARYKRGTQIDCFFWFFLFSPQNMRVGDWGRCGFEAPCFTYIVYTQYKSFIEGLQWLSLNTVCITYWKHFFVSLYKPLGPTDMSRQNIVQFQVHFNHLTSVRGIFDKFHRETVLCDPHPLTHHHRIILKEVAVGSRMIFQKGTFADNTFYLSLPLIQEGQLSVSGERMCAILVNRLED